MIPVLLQTFFPHSHNHSHGCDESAQDDGAATLEKKQSSDETPENSAVETTSESDKMSDDDEYMTICGCVRLKNLSLFISINFGELLHNFTDGIFVGAAYLGCGPAVGNSVVAATVFVSDGSLSCYFFAYILLGRKSSSHSYHLSMYSTKSPINSLVIW